MKLSMFLNTDIQNSLKRPRICNSHKFITKIVLQLTFEPKSYFSVIITIKDKEPSSFGHIQKSFGVARTQCFVLLGTGRRLTD